MPAIDTGALTLSQFAVMRNDPRILAIASDLVNYGSVYSRDIPFAVKPTMNVNYARHGTLTDIEWVRLNETPPTVSTDLSAHSEQAYVTRQTVKTDEVFALDENQIDNPHNIQIRAVLESFAIKFNDLFINNNHRTGDTNAFVGIRERLDYADKYGQKSSLRVDGSGADMTASGNAAAFAGLLEKVRKIFIALGSPNGDNLKIYVNDDLFVRIQTKCALLAGQGGFGTAQDQFGRTVTKFMNAELHPIGTRDGHDDQIITSTESNTGADGASTYTSAYIVNYNERGLSGWQFEPITVKDLPDEQGVLKASLIKWVGGIMCKSARSIARIYNIKMS